MPHKRTAIQVNQTASLSKPESVLPCIRHTELVSQAPSWKLAEQQLNEVHVLSVTKRNVLQLQILQI